MFSPSDLSTLAARGKSRAELRAALFHQLSVEKPRNITDIPSVFRLDLAKNDSLWLAPGSCHGPLAAAVGRAEPIPECPGAVATPASQPIPCEPRRA